MTQDIPALAEPQPAEGEAQRFNAAERKDAIRGEILAHVELVEGDEQYLPRLLDLIDDAYENRFMKKRPTPTQGDEGALRAHDDIVVRLREPYDERRHGASDARELEAADLIERLRREYQQALLDGLPRPTPPDRGDEAAFEELRKLYGRVRWEHYWPYLGRFLAARSPSTEGGQ